MENENRNPEAVTFNTPELQELYEKLNPENKKLFIAKYYELLAEQEAEAAAQECPQYVYFFDCLDGVLSEKYWTAAELSKAEHGGSDPMPEKEIKRIAHNYEATLYRYILDAAGNPTNEACIYDPFDM